MTKIKIEHVVGKDKAAAVYDNDCYNIYFKDALKWVLYRGGLSNRQMVKYVERWLQTEGYKITTTTKYTKEKEQ
jgi:hypothetical protein